MEEIEIEEASVKNQDENNENNLLHEQVKMTVRGSLLIMTFSMKPKLSLVATADLLKLIELHCPLSNLATLEEVQAIFQASKSSN